MDLHEAHAETKGEQGQRMQKRQPDGESKSALFLSLSPLSVKNKLIKSPR